MHPLFRLFGRTMAVCAVLVICSTGYLAWGQTSTRSAIKSTHRLQSRDTATNFCQISGWVVDEKKLPFIGAKVVIRKHGKVLDSTVADFDGYFYFKPLRYGSYSVSIYYPVSRPWRKRIKASTDSITINAVLRTDYEKLSDVVSSDRHLPKKRGEGRTISLGLPAAPFAVCFFMGYWGVVSATVLIIN